MSVNVPPPGVPDPDADEPDRTPRPVPANGFPPVPPQAGSLPRQAPPPVAPPLPGSAPVAPPARYAQPRAAAAVPGAPHPPVAPSTTPAAAPTLPPPPGQPAGATVPRAGATVPRAGMSATPSTYQFAPAHQTEPRYPAGLGRVAPPATSTVVPPAAPSAEPESAPTALGRATPGPVDPGKVEVAQTSVAEEAYKRASTEDKAKADDISLPEVLDTMLAMKASDVHLSVGSPPTVRVHGALVQLDQYPVLDAGVIQRTMYGAITQTQRERFEEELELDFSYSLPERGRFRVNMYKQKDSVGAAFRAIPYEIKSLEELGIPPVVRELANLPRGFVLVTGPTGSGKSTTLAALIDHANVTRHEHIMTVEDPIEFLHEHKNCLVNQREVGTDTNSFNNALKHVLRQDPDIILVGEMRDLETISVALTAAETGHLVFATLHTQDAAQTIDRVIDVFPPHQQQQVRQQLAGSLQGVVCQTLCKMINGRGRVVATEVLAVTPAVRNLIREGKTHQIYSAMQAGAKHGMHTLDQHLAQLVREGKITYETGLDKCHHLADYNKLCGRA